MSDSLAAEFIDLVARHLTSEGQRRTMIQASCPAVAQQLEFGGASSIFAGRLWERLNAYGEIEPGKPATVAFLDELKHTVGIDQRRQIEDLVYALQIERMRTSPNTPPPPSDDIHQQWIAQALYSVRADLSELMPVRRDVDSLKNDVRHHNDVLFGNGDGRAGQVARLREVCRWVLFILFVLVLYGAIFFMFGLAIYGAQ